MYEAQNHIRITALQGLRAYIAFPKKWKGHCSFEHKYLRPSLTRMRWFFPSRALFTVFEGPENLGEAPHVPDHPRRDDVALESNEWAQNSNKARALSFSVMWEFMYQCCISFRYSWSFLCLNPRAHMRLATMVTTVITCSNSIILAQSGSWGSTQQYWLNSMRLCTWGKAKHKTVVFKRKL